MNTDNPAAGLVSAGFAETAEAYDSTGTEFFTAMGQHLVNAAHIPAGASILDVGCGKGAVSIPAARAAGPDGYVTGLDLAPGMLAAAQRRARRAGVTNVQFVRGDAQDPGTVGWDPGSFDAVLAGNVLQFLPQPDRAARAWHGLLTPPGRVAVSWSVAEDPRWVPVIDVFDAAVPAGVMGFAALLRRSPFTSVLALEDMLTRAGFHHPATITHDVTMTYRSPQQWWEAAQSQGPWAAAWRHIPPRQRDRAQAGAFALLDPLRDGDGTLTRTISFACTTARKNPPAPSPAPSGDH